MAAQDQSAVCPGGLRVLVVEDELMISMLVEDMLVELGHHVVALASSIEEAAAIAADGDFDAALLDVDLNGQKVDGIAATLVKRGKPFAFTTGYGARGIPQEFRDRPLLPKPYQMDQLNDVLMRVMRSA
jgi:CheY-like chemotaxis protein